MSLIAADPENLSPLPVNEWLPPPVGELWWAPYRGYGRPPRDSEVLADVRRRFRTLVEREGFDALLNRKLALAVRDAFLDAWRAHLGVDDDVELVVRPRVQGRYAASQLAWYGKVEQLLEMLADATAVALTDLGRQQMGELHDRGFVGQTGRRTAAARRDPNAVPATLDRDTYRSVRRRVIAALRHDGMVVTTSAARRPSAGGTVGALIDDCVRCVSGDVDRADVAARCCTLIAADRELRQRPCAPPPP